MVRKRLSVVLKAQGAVRAVAAWTHAAHPKVQQRAESLAAVSETSAVYSFPNPPAFSFLP